jgi:hypothetical protein
MKRPHIMLLALAISALVLAACGPVGSREWHEIVMTDDAGTQAYGVAYGNARTFTVSGQEVQVGDVIAEPQDDAVTVVGARRIADAATLTAPVDPPRGVSLNVKRIPLTTDLMVTLDEPVDRLHYFDGVRWFDLPVPVNVPARERVVPTQTGFPFRGAGSLTPAEAQAVERFLAADGEALAVAVLQPQAEYDRVRDVRGLDSHRQTEMVVQRGLEVDASAYRAPQRRAVFEVVDQGSIGTLSDQARHELIDSQQALNDFWADVHAGSAEPPAAPTPDFQRETLVGIRLAQKPSGGYGVAVEDVFAEGRQLFVDVRMTEPAAGTLTTSVLTAPWVLVRVLGVDALAVWFRDAATQEIYEADRVDQLD